MRRTLFTCFAIVILFGCAHSARAGWHDFWERVRLDYQRNNCWPDPFRHIDRELVQAPFAIMKDNGWRFENTLPEALFSPETQELTKAGELKARRIATQAPVARRVVFVQRGPTDAITDIRLESVQQYLARNSGRGAAIAVIPTDIEPINASGDYFDQIEKKAAQSIPDPRLPTADASSGGSM